MPTAWAKIHATLLGCIVFSSRGSLFFTVKESTRDGTGDKARDDARDGTRDEA